MKKILFLVLVISVFIAGCATKEMNVATIKLDKGLYEIISEDTILLSNQHIKPHTSNLIIFSKPNEFLSYLEQKFSIAGYGVLVTSEEITLKENDYNFGYILDTINKTKIGKSVTRTLRYTVQLNKTACSKLYEITDNKELLFKSDWFCNIGE